MAGSISKDVTSKPSEQELSPVRYFIIVITAILITETVVMIAMHLFLPPQPLVVEAFIDAFLLSFIIFPFLFIFVFNPLLHIITEHKLTEQRLRASQEKYRSLVEFSPYGIAIHDGEHFMFVNSSGAAMLGAETPDAVIGKAVADFVHPEARGAAKTYIEEILTHGSVFTRLEMKVVRLDGEVTDVEMAAIPFPYQDKMVVHLIANDISDRKRSEEQVRLSLLEKEVLVKELHHRVKNNLQVVYSLLGLQSRYLKDDRDVEIFIESQNRIRTMALVHEELYLSENLAQIDFAAFIRRFSAHMFDSLGPDRLSVELQVTADAAMLDIDTAVPCGLIINELVCNSLKYAFQGRMNGESKVCIDLRKELDQFVLRVSDNGVGLPEGLDFSNASSLGFRLVKILTNQMGASIDIVREKGTQFIITFNRAGSGE